MGEELTPETTRSYLLTGVAFFLLFSPGCTVGPKAVYSTLPVTMPMLVTRDGAVTGLTPYGLQRYNGLVAIYGGQFAPPLHPLNVSESAHLDDVTLQDFVLMSTWSRSGLLSETK